MCTKLDICFILLIYVNHILLQGRHGKGNIYVWASGDGGADDDCNCDGYAASMWTVSINSATNDGQTAGYDESCSSTLASTFSNGKSTLRDAGVVSIMAAIYKITIIKSRQNSEQIKQRVITNSDIPNSLSSTFTYVNIQIQSDISN